MKDTKLYKAINETGEIRWFTSLHKIAGFLGKQRAQVDYHFTKGTPYMGWAITLEEGKDVTWGEIDNY